MVLIGLLLVAAVAVGLGFALASTVWLIVSLVASVLAAIVLVGMVRKQRAERADAARAASAAASTAAVPSGAVPSGAVAGSTASVAAAADPDDVLVVDGEPAYHVAGCATLPSRGVEAIPLTQAAEDGFSACRICKPPTVAAPAATGEVWVVDGYPEFHESGCGELAGRDGEPIPLEQALEDGFTPCQVCASASAVPVPAVAVDGADREVWVADGFPEYHVDRCAELDGLESEPVPYDQATEDGFQPCVVCNPDAVFAAAEPATGGPVGAVGGAGDVWVVDGFPEYHRPDCRRLAAVEAEPIPHEQAVEDGFEPCVLCIPDAPDQPAPGTGTPAAAAADSGPGAALAAGGLGAVAVLARAEAVLEEVWVADGFPDFHRAGCDELNGLDSQPISLEQATEDGFTPCLVCAPDSDEPAAAIPPGAAEAERELFAARADVWVVDGLPDYHREGCKELAGLDAEPVPHDQAIEDGFAPCAVCAPEADGPLVPADDAVAEPEPTLVTAPVAVGAGALTEERDVWVADGFPDYHRGNCAELAGLDAEPVPHDQAVEDGFQPCGVCAPEAAQAPTARWVAEEPELEPEPEPVLVVASAVVANRGAPGDVWVVDGYPDYHRDGCVELVGLDAEPVQHDQAVEDGFDPCSVCTPDGAAPEPAADREPKAVSGPPEPEATAEPEPVSAAAIVAGSPGAREVWVAEGQPDFHRKGCSALEGLAARAIALDQAVEDDFQACEICEPHLSEPRPVTPEPEPVAAAPEPEPEPAAAEPEPEPVAAELEPEPKSEPVAAAPEPEPEPESVPAVPARPAASAGARRVYVVDGRPRYHTADCLIIKGQKAQTVSFDDAVEDGFLPCSLCQRP